MKWFITAMKWVTTVLAAAGIAWSALALSCAFPSFLPTPWQVMRGQELHAAEETLSLATASGGTNMLVSSEAVGVVLSGLERDRGRQGALERLLGITCGLCCVFCVGTIILVWKRV